MQYEGNMWVHAALLKNKKSLHLMCFSVLRDSWRVSQLKLRFTQNIKHKKNMISAFIKMFL